MASRSGGVQGVARRGLEAADAFANRLYGWRYNPLYHTGALVVVLFAILLVTGIYLLLFYRIGAPYESVAAINDQVWGGRWIRALHRYASDATMVAVAIHAVRMWVQDRSWGPRVLAWISGLALLATVMICGWTGLVMIWDSPARVLAQEGARFMDVLPIFSEPVSRTFSGERTMPGAFFFMNLFLHIALPVGMALLVWIHVARVTRPNLFPPRGLTWATVGLLTALAVFWPVPMAEPADLFRLAGEVPLDFFYAFWLPLTRGLPAWAAWAAGGAVSLLLLLVPWLSRPAPEERPAPSVVNERLCTGCTQCAVDCPYEAIQMVVREDGRAEMVARVDPDLCVSCGICAGSCAPMGVGPPERTGRDQLSRVKAFIDGVEPGPDDVVLVACGRGAGRLEGLARFDGAPVFTLDCAGNLHTSVVEFLVRSGAGGVLVASCPPRDCWNREGAVWLEERMYNDREAELQERVDRRRVRLVRAAAAERGRVAAALESFRGDLAALERSEAEDDVDLEQECDVPATGEHVETEVTP